MRRLVPRAVDDLAPLKPVGDRLDAAAGNRDVGAPEVTAADVDETVPEDDVRHYE